MSLMLPVDSASTRSITGVADDLLTALTGAQGNLRPCRSAVLIVVDGLGALQLREHAGHARWLSAGLGKKDTARSVTPTTTAAALTSLLTGVGPGRHGLVGYRVRDPESRAVVNVLSGWEESRADPVQWQQAPTIFERASRDNHPTLAVGLPMYAGTGFSAATLRGATFAGYKQPEERVAAAFAFAEAHEGALVYCYLPEVDKAGHRYGVDSPQWRAALEQIDAALDQRIPPGVGVLVTADHGMIDVPAHRHLVIDEDDRMLDGVAALGGEPRFLHVYLEPDTDAEEALERWREGCGDFAEVMSREHTVREGYWADLAMNVQDRIGHLVVAARGRCALYDGREDPGPRGMIGQHGSLTPEEVLVPYIRRGTFAS
ncbi:alkaline phosphatase family protein [Microbacterium sp. YY-01]|uniref:alkaline phosphatase family protein n=1 Tax=Microbacterium sp. YY-01 TaxID=3421634 RepID=UPI003D17A957